MSPANRRMECRSGMMLHLPSGKMSMFVDRAFVCVVNRESRRPGADLGCAGP